MHTKDSDGNESTAVVGAQSNSHCVDGQYCPGRGGNIDGGIYGPLGTNCNFPSDSSDSSNSTSGVETWCGEHSCCSPTGVCHGDNTDGAESKPSHVTSLPSPMYRCGCSGDCHGCCHGDCGRCGHFDCHDDSGRSGAYVDFGKVGNSSGNGGAACYAPGEAWPGGWSGYDENSYLATKLKSCSSSLKEALNDCRERSDRKSFLSELKDTIFSWLGLVDRAVAKLEHVNVLQDDLYSSKQLLRMQKSRYGNLMEGYVKLEVQLKEVNEDYGHLLVMHEAQEKMVDMKFNRVFHDGSSQTESVAMVDVGSLCSPLSRNLSVQTEPCAAVEVTHTAEGVRCDQSSPSCSVVVAATGENGCETSQRQGAEVSATLRNNEVFAANGAGNCCGQAILVQTECRISADETQGMAYSFPHGRAQNVERARASGTAGTPLLRDQTSEHAGEQSPGRVSAPTITWPCNHYKRLCLVKFDCCEKFYACHRCHNENADCQPKRTLKSIDARMLKCLSCNEVQQITDDSQHCSKCGIEFAKYFCAHCKHFTGMDDSPYHCSKCAICRIRSNVSFHCDTCGVCLDVQLRDKHVCREGSAHDPCCICLEDAFSGCQILPCGHKVHKECAKTMIRQGVKSCPVCRQSFAHQLRNVHSNKTNF